MASGAPSRNCRLPPGRHQGGGKKKRPGNKDCETSCALKLSPYQSGTKQKTPPLFEPTRTSIVGRGPLSQAASPQRALRPTWASARVGGAVLRAAFGAAICRASEKSLAAPTPLRRRYFAVTWPRAIRRQRHHHLSMPKIRSNKHTCAVANILPTFGRRPAGFLRGPATCCAITSTLHDSGTRLSGSRILTQAKYISCQCDQTLPPFVGCWDRDASSRPTHVSILWKVPMTGLSYAWISQTGYNQGLPRCNTSPSQFRAYRDLDDENCVRCRNKLQRHPSPGTWSLSIT